MIVTSAAFAIMLALKLIGHRTYVGQYPSFCPNKICALVLGSLSSVPVLDILTSWHSSIPADLPRGDQYFSSEAALCQTQAGVNCQQKWTSRRLSRNFASNSSTRLSRH